MSKELLTTEGKVEAISPKKDEEKYGIAIGDPDKDENWYNGKPAVPSGIEKGKTVSVAYHDLPNNNIIEDITVVDSQEDVPKQTSKGEGSATTDTKPNTRQDNMDVGLAFKKAVDQVDRRSTETEQDYQDMVVKLTRIHLDVLDEVKNQ